MQFQCSTTGNRPTHFERGHSFLIIQNISIVQFSTSKSKSSCSSSAVPVQYHWKSTNPFRKRTFILQWLPSHYLPDFNGVICLFMRLFEFQNIFQDDVAYLFRNRDATRSQIVNNWTAPAENAGQQDDDVGQRSSWTQKKQKTNYSLVSFLSLSPCLLEIHQWLVDVAQRRLLGDVTNATPLVDESSSRSTRERKCVITSYWNR